MLSWIDDRPTERAQQVGCSRTHAQTGPPRKRTGPLFRFCRVLPHELINTSGRFGRGGSGQNFRCPMGPPFGFSSMHDAILSDKVYVVTKESSGIDWLYDYYLEKGIETNLEKTDTVAGVFYVYKITPLD